MEVKAVQNLSFNKFQNFCADKNTQTNPNKNINDGKKLPDINSQNYALNIKVPQKYTHINTFKIPQVGDAHFYKLQNGQRVVIVPTEGETIVKTHINVGSMNEPDNIRGISHYIEHNLFNGTEKLNAGEFFRTVNQIGAKTNASTGFAKTDYFIATRLLEKNDLEKVIKLHADMIQNPAFKQEQLEKEKGPIISEIAMVLDNDTNLAINKSLKNLFDIKSSSTDIIAGETKNIENLTRKDVVNYFDTWYTPDNMVTVITGEVNPEETINLLAKNFENKNKSYKNNFYFEKLTPVNKPIREDMISQKSNSSKIVLTTVGPVNDNISEQIKAEALLTYLAGYKSSPLKKITTNLDSQIDVNIEKISNNPKESNALMFVFDAPANATETVIKSVYGIIENIYHNKPDKETVETVKNHLLKNYSLMIQNSSNLNDFVGTKFLNCDYNALESIPKLIENLSAEDIQDAAKKYLNLNKASLAVVHAKDINKVAIEQNYKKTNKKINFGCSSKEVVNPKEIKQMILPNNMSVLLDETPTDLSYAQITLKTKVPMNVNPVASPILNKILEMGYTGIKANEYGNNLDKKAIFLAFDVSDKGIIVNINSNEKDLNFALNNCRKVLENPKINEYTFQKTKNKICNLVSSINDSSNDYLMQELFGEDYKKFALKQDLLNALKTVTIDDIKNLHEYILNNASAAATLSVKNINTINQNSSCIKELSKISKNFKDIEYGQLNTYKKNEDKKIIMNVREQKQADIVQVYTFEQSENLKDKVSIDVLNTILGGNPSSRLFMDLREKQKLAYRVYSSNSHFGNTGLLKLNILTTTEDDEKEYFENVNKSLNGFQKHVEQLKEEKISEEELDGAKRFLKARMLEIKDSQTAKNFALLGALYKHEGLDYFNQYMKTIDELSIDDIYNTANYVFANEPITSIVASQKTINNIKD